MFNKEIYRMCFGLDIRFLKMKDQKHFSAQIIDYDKFLIFGKIINMNDMYVWNLDEDIVLSIEELTHNNLLPIVRKYKLKSIN